MKPRVSTTRILTGSGDPAPSSHQLWRALRSDSLRAAVTSCDTESAWKGSRCERTKDKRRRGTDPRQRILSTTPTGTTVNSNPSPRPSWNGPGPTRVGLCSTLAAGRARRRSPPPRPPNRAVGVDLSRPLVELARRRARAAKIANTEFVIADAQTHDFAAGTFDVLISRFGLMFFDDPVRAFTNIRRSLNDDGRAAFVSWQGLHANEWLM